MARGGRARLALLAGLLAARRGAAGPYTRLPGARCEELRGEYPVGAVGQAWSQELLQAAQTLCDAEQLCLGVMRYIGNNEAHCRDWCGRPQFCIVAGAEGSTAALDVNRQWESHVKSALLPALGLPPARPPGPAARLGPSGAAAAPLAEGEPFRQADCSRLGAGEWRGPPVVLLSAELLTKGNMQFPDACRVLYRPFGTDLAGVNMHDIDGILTEVEEKDLPVFSAALKSSPQANASTSHEHGPWRYYFDHVSEYPADQLGFQGVKRHLLSAYFLTRDSYCPGHNNETLFPEDVAADLSPEHVYIEDGTHETRVAAFKHYHFTLICGDFKTQPFPPQPLVYSIAHVAHAFVPEFIHWKASRLLFHLPDAAQGFKTVTVPSLERYASNFLSDPAQEKVMTFKETFAFLAQQLLWYRYREPARGRAEAAACALCDARDREARRAAAGAAADAAVAVAFCAMSRRGAHELRRVVRETWGRALAGAAPGAVQRFFVGRAGAAPLLDAAAGDVVELPVSESYRTLNLKALSMLAWAHERYPNLQWLVRHDDDVYLRADALLAQLAARPPVRYYWGMFDHGSSPVRDPEHQHYNSYEQFAEQKHPAWGDIFPPYARGLLWAMSADLLSLVVAEFLADVGASPGVVLDEAAAGQVPHPDDPAIGVVVTQLVQRGISVNVDDRDLNSFSLNPSCNSTFSNIHNRTWIVHHVKPETMRCMWELDTAKEAMDIAAGNSAIDASQRLFPDLCLCSAEVEEEEDLDEDGPFWYDRQRFNTAR